MNKKLIFLTFILAIFSSVAANAVVNATAVLDNCVNKLTAGKTLSADFVMTGGGRGTVRGKMIVSGNKYAMTSNVTSTWYDGKNQWTADHSLKEVNLFEPTADEVAEANPFAIIKNYKKGFSSKLLTASGGVYSVQLTPNTKSAPFSKVVVTLSSSTYLPTKIVSTMRDGTVVTLSISNIKTGVNLQASQFVFNKKAYPGYSVIDLR